MTEAEWLSSTDPTPMLEFLRGKASDRKLRLFAVACCHFIWPLLTDERARVTVETAEDYADGLATENSRRDLVKRYCTVRGLSNSLDSAVSAAGWCVASPFTVTEAEHCTHCAVYARIHYADEVGDITYKTDDWPESYNLAMDPMRSATKAAQASLLHCIFNPFHPITLDPSWLTSTVTTLARSMYDTRDFTAMPILADALQDAGCDDDQVLSHCRGEGVHVRGCFLIDLLTGRE